MYNSLNRWTLSAKRVGGWNDPAFCRCNFAHAVDAIQAEVVSLAKEGHSRDQQDPKCQNGKHGVSGVFGTCCSVYKGFIYCFSILVTLTHANKRMCKRTHMLVQPHKHPLDSSQDSIPLSPCPASASCAAQSTPSRPSRKVPRKVFGYLLEKWKG